MENKLPEHIQKQIEREASDYATYQGETSRGVPTPCIDGDKWEAYEAGATAYAHYKERWEQAMKALEELTEISEWMFDNCRLQEGKEASKSNLFKRPANAIDQANNFLASWKEEGKGGGNG